MARLRARIKKFNSMFTDVEEDDQYSFVFHVGIRLARVLQPVNDTEP